jgi:hypothetical protein
MSRRSLSNAYQIRSAKVLATPAHLRLDDDLETFTATAERSGVFVGWEQGRALCDRRPFSRIW